MRKKCDIFWRHIRYDSFLCYSLHEYLITALWFTTRALTRREITIDNRFQIQFCGFLHYFNTDFEKFHKKCVTVLPSPLAWPFPSSKPVLITASWAERHVCLLSQWVCLFSYRQTCHVTMFLHCKGVQTPICEDLPILLFLLYMEELITQQWKMI